MSFAARWFAGLVGAVIVSLAMCFLGVELFSLAYFAGMGVYAIGTDRWVYGPGVKGAR